MKISPQQCDLKRRKFLKLSALLGIGTVSTAILPPASAEAFLFSSKEYKVVKTHLAMGTFVSITAIHSSRDEAENAIGLAFEEVDRLDKMLTCHGDSSPVVELNHFGKLDAAPHEVQRLLRSSLAFYKQTDGAFDITVKPVIDLYKQSFAAGNKPTEAEISQVLQRIGTDNLHLSGQGLAFGKDGMGVTLDGIAKGYIVDRASAILQEKGVVNHMVNAGGDIRTCGAAAKDKAWTVAIQDPAKKSIYPNVIKLKDGAVATSGNYEVYYDQERVFHHIVNSHSGLSPQLSTSVTVTAPTVMEADALSTTVFVMEPSAGLAYINSLPKRECFIIAKDEATSKSEHWPV